MTPKLALAFANLRSAVDALEAAINEAPIRKPTPVVTPTVLPTPATPAKGALTDLVRADNLPAAQRIALDVLKIVGVDHPNLMAGVRGQLALSRIPCDDLLVTQAIEGAKRQL